MTLRFGQFVSSATHYQKVKSQKVESDQLRFAPGQGTDLKVVKRSETPGTSDPGADGLASEHHKDQFVHEVREAVRGYYGVEAGNRLLELAGVDASRWPGPKQILEIGRNARKMIPDESRKLLILINSQSDLALHDVRVRLFSVEAHARLSARLADRVSQLPRFMDAGNPPTTADVLNELHGLLTGEMAADLLSEKRRVLDANIEALKNGTEDQNYDLHGSVVLPRRIADRALDLTRQELDARLPALTADNLRQMEIKSIALMHAKEGLLEAAVDTLLQPDTRERASLVASFGGRCGDEELDARLRAASSDLRDFLKTVTLPEVQLNAFRIVEQHLRV